MCPPGLWEVCPTLSLKQFYCWSDSHWLFLVLSMKVVELFFFLYFRHPGDGWCDFLGFVPTDRVSSSSTLQIFRGTFHLWWLVCPQSICSVIFSDSGMSRTMHPQESSKVEVGLCHMLVWASYSTLNFFHSQPIKCVTIMALVIWLSPMEAIQRRTYVSVSTFIVKLEVETLQVALYSSMLVAPGLTGTVDWVSSELDEILQFVRFSLFFLLLFFSTKSMISESALSASILKNIFPSFPAEESTSKGS